MTGTYFSRNTMVGAFFVIGTVTVDCQKEGETDDKQGFDSETQKRSGSG